jgi:ubiquinol-cytochrome c reductase cytochrome c subunit
MMKAAAAMLALLALGPWAARAQSPSGQDLYQERCASCHGEHGQGSSAGPTLVGRSAADVHLMLDTGRMPAAAPYANEIHKAPQLTDAQMAQLVRYVRTFSPKADATLPKILPGNVVRGRALFAENCAQCHGASGEGASVGNANVAPSLMNATVFQVAEAIRAGPEIMPRFGRDTLSDRDVSDIARYVNFVQTQSDRPHSIDSGGIPLGHLGPVAEGFVAWFFGLGALALFVRRIGTTD